jgi:hypothetical protein
MFESDMYTGHRWRCQHASAIGKVSSTWSRVCFVVAYRLDNQHGTRRLTHGCRGPHHHGLEGRIEYGRRAVAAHRNDNHSHYPKDTRQPPQLLELPLRSAVRVKDHR